MKGILKKNKGSFLSPAFTLIELIGVISVIVILLSIIIPISNNVVQSARRTKAANQLRQFAIATSQLAQENPSNLLQLHTSNIYDFIAHFSYLTELNHSNLYIIEEDPFFASQKYPPYILSNPSDKTSISSESLLLPIAFAFPSKIDLSFFLYNLPIAWTRGLLPDGTWSKHSPYQGKGGHIVFADGTVKWFKKIDLDSSQLVTFQTLTPTKNIHDCFPKDTKILEFSPSLF